MLPAAISPRSYVRDFNVYARTLNRFAPGVPLLGPAVAKPKRSLRWITQLIRRDRRYLGAVTAHRYPYSACVHRSAGDFPTVARLLSPVATAGVTSAVAPAAAQAHRAGLPFRMTELNSVTCGGRAGVSNTFATALWAPDALFGLMRVGVDGVNIHVRADTVNAAMVPAAGGPAGAAPALRPDAVHPHSLRRWPPLGSGAGSGRRSSAEGLGGADRRWRDPGAADQQGAPRRHRAAGDPRQRAGHRAAAGGVRRPAPLAGRPLTVSALPAMGPGTAVCACRRSSPASAATRWRCRRSALRWSRSAEPASTPRR